jgi:hypothetical protein
MKVAVVVPFPQKVPHPRELKEQISQLAGRGDMSFDDRVFDNRSGVRSVDIEDARRVLINGVVQDDIKPTSTTGIYKCKVIDKDDETTRWLSVSIVMSPYRLLITSIRWNDE